MNKNIFISTTLPYCNGNMHVGAAFEFILGDVFNRYFKNNGYNTHFNIGLDQNGSKILAKAKELNIPVKDYVNSMSKIWLESINLLQIGYDNFYQTSSDEHSVKVKEIWNTLLKNKELYKKEYNGKYCLGCESFKLDKDLINNKCPEHPNIEIQEISEENYFLNLHKYKNNLLSWLNNNPLFDSDRNELIKYINDYGEISISRKKTDFTFGIEVPNDDSQIIFIWFEALCNYLIAADKWVGWENCYTIQLCGKDNNRFQSQIWQSILLHLNKKNTDKILIHGTILDDRGRKMSKTLGNVVDPVEQVSKYGVDAVRYYCTAGINTYTNSGWNEVDLVNLYNANICNDWGNLLSRVLHLVDTKCNGEVVLPDNDLQIETFLRDIETAWNNFQIKDALHQTNLLVKHVNKYLNDKEPWKLENPVQIISNVYSTLNIINDKYYPVFPSKYLEVKRAILNKKKEILFTKLVIPK